MIAIKLVAIGLLAMAGSAGLGGWQDKPGDPTSQQGSADSADSDLPAEQQNIDWLVGRWCDRGRLWVTILEGHELMMPDGAVHPYRLSVQEDRYVTVVFQIPAPGGGYGFEGVANYDSTLGEPSFSLPGSIAWPLGRC